MSQRTPSAILNVGIHEDTNVRQYLILLSNIIIVEKTETYRVRTLAKVDNFSKL